MKILVYTPVEGAMPPVCDVELYPDSSLVFTNRALFLPEFDVCCRTALVARIGRLGKSIAPQYAFRYCDAITAGLVTAPVEAVSNPELRCFDGALASGVMLARDCATASEPQPEWRNGDQVWPSPCGPLWPWLREAIATASRHMTLKTGDLLYLASAQRQPVKRGDVLHATLDGQDVLTIRAK